MKALVTGGSGFLGRKLIESLCRQNWSVIALARSERSAEKVSDAGATVAQGDLLDPTSLLRAADGCDAVFHAAAMMAMWGREREQESINVGGTRNVVNACLEAGVPCMIHVSAAAVISDGGPIVGADETWPVPDRPFGAYARSKAAAERIVLQANGDKLKAVAIRPPAIWGAGDQNFLPEIVRAVQKYRFVWIDGGQYPYTICHVDNVCEGAILAVTKGYGGQAYFLADSQRDTFRNFITMLLSAYNIRPRIPSIPRSIAWYGAWLVEGIWRSLQLKNDPPITRTIIALIGGAVDIRDYKARKDLGYVGRVTLSAGLDELSREVVGLHG